MEIILKNGRPLTLNEAYELENKLREIAPEIVFFSYRRGWRQFFAELESEYVTGFPVILFANALHKNFAATYTMVMAASDLPNDFETLFPGYSVKWASKIRVTIGSSYFL